MIPYCELRDRLLNWPKHPDCRPVLRAPLITPGFPGTFNMSSTEHHWLQEYGGYIDWDHDFVFTTIQSCVRLNDFAHLAGESGRNYLGVFEMADLSGEIALRERPDYVEAQHWQVREFVRFLAQLGIGPGRVHASYCAGGKVAELTSGAYGFDFDIPADEATHRALLDAGIPGCNLIPDCTRDTLLSLHIHRASPWGFRNEIFIDIGTAGQPQLLDVATAEHLKWNPVFRGSGDRENIVGLESIRNGYFGLSFGVERLCMAVNGARRVQEVDYLQPFYRTAERIAGHALTDRDYYIGESLRALHRIYTDCHFHSEASVRVDKNGHTSMGLKRRKKAALLKRNIPLALTRAELELLLAAHTEAQPWHEHLAEGIELTIEEIGEYRESHAARLIPAI